MGNEVIKLGQGYVVHYLKRDYASFESTIFANLANFRWISKIQILGGSHRSK